MDNVTLEPKQAAAAPATLTQRMARSVGRYASKVPDWDAFPASRGYPELSRSQIRFIGAGGSPKVNDPGKIVHDGIERERRRDLAARAVHHEHRWREEIGRAHV